MAAGKRMRITKLSVGTMDNNVYVVACPDTGEAVIIDAAAEPERITAEVEGLSPLAILTTHGHQDHVGAVGPVREALGVPFRLHPADAGIAGREPDLLLEDGEVIRVGDHSLRALHTPGHTPGSICFLLTESTGTAHLFSGDTLFPGGPGATRFPYSSFPQIMESLERRLFVLPDATAVHPGHGADTTIGNERPSIPEWRARGW